MMTKTLGKALAVLRAPRTVLLSTLVGLFALGSGVAGLHPQGQSRSKGPFPFLDPEATVAWQLGDHGPELVLRAVTHLTPGVRCDGRAVLTRYWDVGGELIVAWPQQARGRPVGPFYPIDKLDDGQAGEVRFQADEVPENARDYVTQLTAPIGACGEGGWWGAGESVRLAIPPRPDLRP